MDLKPGKYLVRLVFHWNGEPETVSLCGYYIDPIDFVKLDSDQGSDKWEQILGKMMAKKPINYIEDKKGFNFFDMKGQTVYYFTSDVDGAQMDFNFLEAFMKNCSMGKNCKENKMTLRSGNIGTLKKKSLVDEITTGPFAMKIK